MKPLHRFARFHAYVAVCPLTALQFCLCYLQRCDRFAYILRYVQQCDRFNRYILSSTAVWPLWCIYTTVSFGLSSVRHFLFMAWYTFRCLFQAIYIYITRGVPMAPYQIAHAKWTSIVFVDRYDIYPGETHANPIREQRVCYEIHIKAKWQNVKRSGRIPNICVLLVSSCFQWFGWFKHMFQNVEKQQQISWQSVSAATFSIFYLMLGNMLHLEKQTFSLQQWNFEKTMFSQWFYLFLLISTYFLHSLLITYLKVTYVT